MLAKREIWRDIKGYEGLYQVSDYGRIKTLERKIQHGNYSYTRRERIMSQSIDKDGYMRIGLTKNKKHITCQVHRIVAETFLENNKGFTVVNHKDYDRTNNKASNLEWCDSKYNVQYSLCRRPITQNKKVGKSGLKHILIDERYYHVYIRNRFVKVHKRFKTLESAITYRNEVLNEIGIAI